MSVRQWVEAAGLREVCPRSVVVLASLGALLLAPVAGAQTQAEEQAQNKRAAVERVVNSHDEAMVVGAARLIARQAALRLARGFLADWGHEAKLGEGWTEEAGQWKLAEALLMSEAATAPLSVIGGTAWVKEIRTQYVSDGFGGEEADAIATHFESEDGRAQVALMDWFMGETTLFVYTFTGRFKYDLRGAEGELRALQEAAESRLPAKDNELEFSTKHRSAFQFAACSPQSPYCQGPKYAKMLAIPLQGAVIRRIDDTGTAIQAAMLALRPRVQPYLDAFKAGQ